MTHLCDLEAGYGGVGLQTLVGPHRDSNPGRSSCMRVRSRSHYATGAAPKLTNYIIISFLFCQESLGEPFGRVLFAGEATDPNDFSTMHGAR